MRINLNQNLENKKQLIANTIQREKKSLLSLSGPRRMLIIDQAIAWLQLGGGGGGGGDQNV